MVSKKKTIVCVMLIFILSIHCVFVQVHGHEQQDPKYGGTLIETSNTDTQLFNPVISSDPVSKKIESFIFEGMVTYDKEMKIVPCLAKSYDISLDRLDYTFYLREDVYWHDGEPFTADDVIFTWDRIMDPETDTTRRSMFELLDIEHIPYEKINGYTVEFHLTETFAPMLNNMMFPIIPEHVYQNHLGGDGIPHTVDDCRDPEGAYNFNDDPINTASEGKKPIGTGCMMFEEWEVDDHITLIRNSEENEGPGYWDGHDAYLDGYEMRIIVSIDKQLEMLQSGEVDLMDLSSTPREAIEHLNADSNINIYKAPTYTSDHIAYQCDPEKGNLYGKTERDFEENPNHFAGFTWQAEQYPSLDIYGYKVRQALSYALDKQGLIEYAYPFGERNLGPMYVAQTEWYNDQVNPYTYDLQKANQLLDDAGFGTTADDPKRNELNFTISFNQGNLRRQKTCQFAKKQWENLGLNVSIEALEWINILGGWWYRDPREFDAYAAGWTGGGGDPDLTNVWSSRNILPGGQPTDIDPNGHWVWSGDGKQGGLNYASYWNPTVDELLDIARTEPDKLIRKTYYDQIQEMIVDDAPYTWLISHVNMFGINASFKGFVENSVAGLWPEPVGFHNIYCVDVLDISSSSTPTSSANPRFKALQGILTYFTPDGSNFFELFLIMILSIEVVALITLIRHIKQKKRQ